MVADVELAHAVRVLLEKSFAYRYYRNFTWLGRPIIQYPQDVVALQELVWKYRPTLIVETGVAHGGSLILYASLLELAGGEGRVVGVEIELREHNRKALLEHPLSRRIEVVEGSSTDPAVVERVRARAGGQERVMVVLDSHHSHEHVLAELRLYSPLVRRGGYLVVFGTSVAALGEDVRLDRPWNRHSNPKTALDQFLKESKRFVVDKEISDKLLLTDAPGGYLLCVADDPR